MFGWEPADTVAHLVEVHHDLWPWRIFRGHLKVTNVEIANILLSVWDRHVVTNTMKHYLEVDIGLSESANKFDLGLHWRVISRSWKWKLHVATHRWEMDHACHWTRNLIQWFDSKKIDLAPWVGHPSNRWASWFGYTTRKKHRTAKIMAPYYRQVFIGKVTIVKTAYIFFDGARYLWLGYYESLMGTWPQRFRIRNDLRPWFNFKGPFQGHESENGA